MLEIISLVISGRVRGRWASEDLNPYWFNHSVVERYFAIPTASSTKRPPLPEIDLEVYFSDDTDGAARLRGVHNSEGSDCPGLRMKVAPDPEHVVELKAYLAEEDLPHLIPTDLYTVEWTDFSGKTVARQPNGLGLALVNHTTATNSAGIDYKLRQLVRDFVSPTESAKIGLEHRRSKARITDSSLQPVNDRITDDGMSFGVTLQMDQSANSSWDSMVTPHIQDTPFSMLGQGRQVSTKIAIAMGRRSAHTQFILVEEPENHLSHTEMQKLLDQIETLADERQLFITTHSSFVLNRLGLDTLHLIHKAQLAQFESIHITEDTIKYFQKQSGYDTLRLAIAEKVVVVEGPSDEMIFNLAYSQLHDGKAPRTAGIDVITLGTRGKRALELGKALGKKMAVLRDNDGKDPEHWKLQATDLIEEGEREMFVGSLAHGRTLEPQVVRADGKNGGLLRTALGLDASTDLEKHMLSDKTEWAWEVAEAAPDLVWPSYILDAIGFIDAD